ncbi:unnamed protein product [Heligmosomoides polygyrus]|uniref:LITAF domain-containing protein n=1 Tax=Heligmosomoides polygyrus TaxID=6339 RepID=A0A183FE32_HELPZ|nr:unnamed protein product [Heligmosomoides polygyrus]
MVDQRRQCLASHLLRAAAPSDPAAARQPNTRAAGLVQVSSEPFRPLLSLALPARTIAADSVCFFTRPSRVTPDVCSIPLDPLTDPVAANAYFACFALALVLVLVLCVCMQECGRVNGDVREQPRLTLWASSCKGCVQYAPCRREIVANSEKAMID